MHFDYVAHPEATHFRVKHDAPLSTAATFAAFKIVPAIFGHLADLLGTTEDAVLMTPAIVGQGKDSSCCNRLLSGVSRMLRIS